MRWACHDSSMNWFIYRMKKSETLLVGSHLLTQSYCSTVVHTYCSTCEINSPRDSELSSLSRGELIIESSWQRPRLTVCNQNLKTESTVMDSEPFGTFPATLLLWQLSPSLLSPLPEYVFQQLLHLRTRHQLCKNVSQIRLRILLGHLDGPRCNCFAHAVEVDGCVFLL